MKFQNRAQIPIGIILAIGGAVGGSIIWIYNLINPINEAVAENRTNIATVQEAIKSLPEMKSDIRETRDNMIKLMVSQGLKPTIQNELASSTLFQTNN